MTRTLSLRCACGTDFTASMPHAGRAPRFCSDDCRRRARRSASRPLLARECAICSAPFRTTNRSTVCCGRPCGQVLAKRRSDATRSANASARAKRYCEACGVEFLMRNPSGAARAGRSREGRFCSRKCRADAARHARQLEMFAPGVAP